MKSYLKKNNLQYFIFSQNSEKSVKTVNRHPSPDTPAEGLRLQHHQREAIDDEAKSTKWTNPLGKLPFIPCCLNKKRKIS
jgi:hypothetical protein